MASHPLKTSSGFTLIELSIVLVIIGLIVGGVLVGKDLIKAAELRAIPADWDRFVAANRIFKDKYACIPGDCIKASQFGLGANGNGNSYVDIYVGTFQNESWEYWRHLANAGLIEGSYTGVAGPESIYWDAVAGVNVPKSKYGGNVGYSIFYLKPFYTAGWQDGALASWGYQTLAANDHIINTGRDSGARATNAGTFPVDEARLVNQKVDDSFANSGKVRSVPNDVLLETTCTTGTVPDYSYGTSGVCNLYYVFEP